MAQEQTQNNVPKSAGLKPDHLKSDGYKGLAKFVPIGIAKYSLSVPF